MRDRMTYISSSGKRIEFGQGYILINESDLRDYEWEYNSSYSKVKEFKQSKLVPKKLPVIIYGPDMLAIANEIHDIVESDVANCTPGRLYIGDYYASGYFYGSSKKSYTKAGSIELELAFVKEASSWINEITYIYRKELKDTGVQDFPHDYPFNYAFSGRMDYADNPTEHPAEFVMTIYGTCSNPAITIGTNQYVIYEDLEIGEYITINSREKKAIKTKVTGEQINVFYKRNRQFYLYQKIPAGNQYVNWNGFFCFDLTIFAERSEPEWK